MIEKTYHIFYGNDVPPWVVAIARGAAGAVVLGALGFLGMWQVTDEPKALIIAALQPAFSYAAIRIGLEGFIDNRKTTRRR